MSGAWNWVKDKANSAVDWMGGKTEENTLWADQWQDSPEKIGQKWSGYYGSKARQAQAREAPQLGPEQGQMRGQQQGLIEALQARAAGQTPSIAEMSYRQGQEQNLAGAMATMAAQRGISPGGANRAIMNQQAAQSQQGARDLGMLRAEEQSQAQGLLGQALSGARGQDLQAGEIDIQSMLQQRQLNDELTAKYLSEGFSRDEADLKAKIMLQELKARSHDNATSLNMQGSWHDQDSRQKTIGSGASASGTALTTYF